MSQKRLERGAFYATRSRRAKLPQGHEIEMSDQVTLEDMRPDHRNPRHKACPAYRLSAASRLLALLRPAFRRLMRIFDLIQILKFTEQFLSPGVLVQLHLKQAG